LGPRPRNLQGFRISEGPFTVLAPVAEAFEGMDLDELLSDVEALTAILLRHVIAASVYAADVTDGPVETVGGDIITASTESGVGYVRFLLLARKCTYFCLA